MKYEIRVNYKPEIHEGCMKHYWQIVLITNDGVYTVKHGWSRSLSEALCNALLASKYVG